METLSIDIDRLFWIAIPIVLSGIIGWVVAQMNKLVDRNRAVEDGVRSLLKDRIIQAYEFWHEDRGYCPVRSKEALEDMYEQYHKLGGNGTVTKIRDEMLELPTKENKK